MQIVLIEFNFCSQLQQEEQLKSSKIPFLRQFVERREQKKSWKLQNLSSRAAEKESFFQIENA